MEAPQSSVKLTYSTSSVTNSPIQNNSNDLSEYFTRQLSTNLKKEGWKGTKEEFDKIKKDEYKYRGYILRKLDVKRLLSLSAIDSSKVVKIETTIPTSTLVTSSPVEPSVKINDINVGLFFKYFKKLLVNVRAANEVRNSNIAVLGRAGTGKSTFINSVLGVRYGSEVDIDSFVLQALDNESAPSSREAQSCTKAFNSYPLGKSKVKEEVGKDFFLLDSPGFLETRGKERELAMNIAFCNLFSSSDHLKSLGIVLDLRDFLADRIINLQAIAERIDEIVRDSVALLSAGSIFFVLTQRDNCQEIPALRNIENFFQHVMNIARQAMEKGNSRMVKFLSLMNRENMYFADFPKADWDGLLEKISKAKPLDKDAVSYRFMGNRKEELRSFIDEYYKKLLSVKKEKEHLEVAGNILNQIVSNAEHVLKINQERRENISNDTFKTVPFSEPAGFASIIENMNERINTDRIRIEQLKILIQQCNETITKKEKEEAFTAQRTKIRSLVELEKAYNDANSALYAKNKDDLDVLESFIVNDPRSWLPGWLPFNLSRTKETFIYRCKKPFVKIRRDPEYPSTPSSDGHQYVVNKENKDEGIYEATYTSAKGENGICTVEVLGKKWVKYREDILALKTEIAQIEKEMEFQESNIQVNRAIKTGYEGQIENLNKHIASLEGRIKCYAAKNQKEFDENVAKQKAEFEQYKQSLLKDITESDVHANSIILTTREKLNDIGKSKARLALHIQNEKILFEEENIRLMESICKITQISTTNTEAFKTADKQSLEDVQLLCALSGEIMIDPVLHNCGTNFDKEKILAHIEAQEKEHNPSLCPSCQKPIKKTDLASNPHIKKRLKDFQKNLVNYKSY